MTDFKQTWWDDNLNKRYDEFASWVGSSKSPSKIWARTYVKDGNYKSIIDLGCGNATEFFAYKEEQPNVKYLGVDSSKFLYDRNTNLGIPMVLSPIEKTGLEDNHSEVAFSRHVLEHQPGFKPVLKEIIRLGSKLAIHVFFIIPKDDPEHIGYNPYDNLYHNRYNKQDIETFVKEQPGVKDFNWISITSNENALIIKKAQ